MNWIKHWATVLLGCIVAAILFITVFSFQVEENQTAVINTMSTPSVVKPGKFLNFRWPYPFQDLTKYDHRMRTFGGISGKIEEMQTADGQSIVVGIFINYRIGDALKFYLSLNTVDKAEKELDSLMRSAKWTTLGNYPFHDIVNADGKTLYPAILDEMRRKIAEPASRYGLSVEYVGVNVLNVPTSISEDVFKRMIASRKEAAQKYLSEGDYRSRTIRTDADKVRDIMLAQAEAKARETRALGDAEAAQYYSVFQENPELAAFLRKLDSLGRILKERTTLIVDTSVAPFDVLSPQQGGKLPSVMQTPGGEKKD